MENRCNPCRYEMAYKVQFRSFGEDLTELKERVGKLENALTRAVMLLVANLGAVVLSLAQQLLAK